MWELLSVWISNVRKQDCISNASVTWSTKNKISLQHHEPAGLKSVSHMIRHIFMNCNDTADYDLLVEMIIGVKDAPIWCCTHAPLLYMMLLQIANFCQMHCMYLSGFILLMLLLNSAIHISYPSFFVSIFFFVFLIAANAIMSVPLR